MLDTTRIQTNAHTLDALARHAPATDDLLELADWLQANGAHHLSAIERIELAERLISRRRFLIGAGALVLAGCGALGGGAPTTNPVATRRITHALGETEVPANPQRIVVVGYNESEDLVALGVTPVGIMYDADTHLFLADALRDVPVVGAEGRPNLEKIAALQPDVIIAVNWAVEGVYPELSTIAPTVVIDRGAGFGDWQESLRLVAETVGRSEEATRLLDDYEDRVVAISAALKERQLDNLQVSVFGSWNAQYAVFNYVEGFPIGILNDVGLQITEIQRELYATNPAAFDSMSLEFLPQLDGDVIFFLDSTIEGQEGDQAFVSSVKTNPLFTQLKAVQEGRLCKVPYGRWNEGSIFAANLILDDIERCLL